jgi:hypothetical protein
MLTQRWEIHQFGKPQQVLQWRTYTMPVLAAEDVRSEESRPKAAMR